MASLDYCADSKQPDVNIGNIGQREATHRKYKRLKLGGGQAYGRTNDKLDRLDTICFTKPGLTRSFVYVCKILCKICEY
jgi:hypothetical protein